MTRVTSQDPAGEQDGKANEHDKPRAVLGLAEAERAQRLAVLEGRLAARLRLVVPSALEGMVFIFYVHGPILAVGMNARNAIRGARAQAAGEAFEELVEGLLKAATQTGLVADWEHTQPLFRRLGAGRFAPVAAGRADYSGMLVGGLAFALECKSTKEARFYRRQLPPRQVAHLDATLRGGGLALLAVEFREAIHVHRFAIPWGAIPWARALSADSIRASALEIHRLRYPWLLEPHLARCEACGRASALGRHTCCVRSAP